MLLFSALCSLAFAVESIEGVFGESPTPVVPSPSNNQSSYKFTCVCHTDAENNCNGLDKECIDSADTLIDGVSKCLNEANKDTCNAVKIYGHQFFNITGYFDKIENKESFIKATGMITFIGGTNPSLLLEYDPTFNWYSFNFLDIPVKYTPTIQELSSPTKEIDIKSLTPADEQSENPVEQSNKQDDESEKPMDASANLDEDSKLVMESDMQVDILDGHAEKSDKPVEQSEQQTLAASDNNEQQSEKPIIVSNVASDQPVDISEKPVEISKKPEERSENLVEVSEILIEGSNGQVDASAKPVDVSNAPVEQSDKIVEQSVEESNKQIDVSDKVADASEKLDEASNKQEEVSENLIDESEILNAQSKEEEATSVADMSKNAEELIPSNQAGDASKGNDAPALLLSTKTYTNQISFENLSLVSSPQTLEEADTLFTVQKLSTDMGSLPPADIKVTNALSINDKVTSVIYGNNLLSVSTAQKTKSFDLSESANVAFTLVEGMKVSAEAGITRIPSTKVVLDKDVKNPKIIFDDSFSSVANKNNLIVVVPFTPDDGNKVTITGPKDVIDVIPVKDESGNDIPENMVSRTETTPAIATTTSKGLSAGGIVGIVIGSVAFVVIVVLVIYCFVCKNKNSSSSSSKSVSSM